MKRGIILLAIFLFGSQAAFAADNPEELKQAINAKNQALQEVNLKLLQTQKDLEATQTQGKSLQQQIKTFDSNISRLNLTIRSSELTIDKLGLEITSLNDEIDGIEKEMTMKKDAVSDLLRELQRKSEETVLTSFLRSKSLAEAVTEAQSIVDLNSGLSDEVTKLKDLNDQLSQKLADISGKKSDMELENKNLKYRKQITETQKTDRQTLLQQTKNQEKTYQQMVADLEKQQESLSDEIQKFEDELRAKFDPNLETGKRPGVLSWPVVLQSVGGTGRISQHFGEVSGLYRGRPHNGMDIATPLGTPVFAAADGKVIAVGNNDVSAWRKYQYGKHIMIEHANNLTTLYAHLSKQVVSVGDTVQRGTLIGYSGNTGYSTGPHLHFGLYWSPSVIFKSIPPAAGVVPIGVILAPEDYLPTNR